MNSKTLFRSVHDQKVGSTPAAKSATAKFDGRYPGPFTVSECIGNTAYGLKLPADMRIHNVSYFVVEVVCGVAPDLPRCPKSPPPQFQIDSELQYEGQMDHTANSDTSIDYRYNTSVARR
ncbi:hypothetical protein V1517DRAFT_337180 [Lipomyces orientalis]|uniref:Uncharacterized protein n=1 Tax=Lipomyces orientalis TaxID=1233043 RepID=A0ACC3TS68_9ASCO